MNHQFNRNNNKGFTLIELLVVIVIIGILLVIVAPNIFNTGARDQANAQTIETFSDKFHSAWRTIIIQNGSARNPINNPFFANANHTFLDVLAGGRIAVSAADQAWYDTDGPGIMTELTIATAPTAAAAGVYLVAGEYQVDLAAYNAATGELQITYANVPTAVVQEIQESKEPTGAFDPAAADNVGNVRYTVADANGEHTLTRVIFIK